MTKHLQYPTLTLIVLILLASANLARAAGRMFYDGFESGNTNQWLQDDFRNKCPVVTSTADGHTGPFAGTKMTRCNWNGTVAWNNPAAYESLKIPTVSYNNEILYRVRVRADENLEASKYSQTKITRIQGNFQNEVFNCVAQSAGQMNTVLFANSGLPTYWGGSAGDKTATRTAWHTLEFYFNNATGTIKVWHDNVLVRNTSGLYMPLHMSTFYLTSNWADPHDATNYVYFDEIEVYSDTGTGASGLMSDATISSGSGSQTAPNTPTNAQVLTTP